MNNYIQWVLRRDHRECSAPIPVPPPIHTGIIATLEGSPRGGKRAIFLCHTCGLATFYSDADLYDEMIGTPGPYLQQTLSLAYIEVGCDKTDCEPPTMIHAVWDVANKTYLSKLPTSEWKLDEGVVCGCGRQLMIDPLKTYTPYSAQMPF